MRYYTWHIGDYQRDAGHLSHIEDAVYRRLLDVYYGTEKPLPLKFSDVCYLTKAKKNFELLATKKVLKQFFVKHADGYHNKRADEEIAKFRAKSEVRSQVAKKGWSDPSRRGTHANAMQLHNGSDAKAFLPFPIPHSPVPSSQKEDQREREKPPSHTRGDGLPKDWKPDSDLLTALRTARPDLDMQFELAKFADHHSTKQTRSGNWNLKFRDWINQARRLNGKTPNAGTVRARTVAELQELAIARIRVALIDHRHASDADIAHAAAVDVEELREYLNHHGRIVSEQDAEHAKRIAGKAEAITH